MIIHGTPGIYVNQDRVKLTFFFVFVFFAPVSYIVALCFRIHGTGVGDDSQ